jgi:PTH1 family peptidyl-tRNA hydrolase
MNDIQQGPITVVIGLGNPGPKYALTRHNIGFRVLDFLCQQYSGSWRSGQLMDEATITINGKPVALIKPQTFMNNSGNIIAPLRKRGIQPENMLVVHDELEIPFGQVKYRFGGSARGHNGLRSLIEACGSNFGRIRCGIGRPERKEEVPDYVLQPFNEPASSVEKLIEQASQQIEALAHKIP